MPTFISGGCLCGAVKYRADGAAKFAIRCYCRDCRQLSGAGSLPQVAVDRAGWMAAGPLKVHIRRSDAGHPQEVGFCGKCGSTIYRSTDRLPDTVFLAAGTLDDEAMVPPLRNVHEDAAPAWELRQTADTP